MIRDGLTEDELIQAKNKVLARSVLRSERPMGRLASLGFHWMYRRAYIPGRSTSSKPSIASPRTTCAGCLPTGRSGRSSIVSVGPTTEIHPPG